MKKVGFGDDRHVVTSEWKLAVGVDGWDDCSSDQWRYATGLAVATAAVTTVALAAAIATVALATAVTTVAFTAALAVIVVVAVVALTAVVATVVTLVVTVIAAPLVRPTEPGTLDGAPPLYLSPPPSTRARPAPVRAHPAPAVARRRRPAVAAELLGARQPAAAAWPPCAHVPAPPARVAWHGGAAPAPVAASELFPLPCAAAAPWPWISNVR
eukprot:XP_008663862.1 predicted GPI-anchored protein 58 [Zea mays]